MSTRAYKLIEIKTAPNFTFNVSSHYDLVEKYGQETNNQDIILFEPATIDKALKTETDKEIIQILKAIKKDIGNNEYVEYYCF